MALSDKILKKEKKSRLKDLKDLLEALPDRFKEPKEESKIPEGLKDFLKKRIKDRDFWKKIKPVPMPEMIPDPDRIKPVPMPKYIPPYELDPSLPRPVPMPKGFPDRRYWQQPTPKRFDPERGPDPRYWAEAASGKPYPKEIYTINGIHVTKEEHDAFAEKQKEETKQYEKESVEQDMLYNDVNSLTMHGQQLYEMKLKELGLSRKEFLPMDEHIKIMNALNRLTEQGKGAYIQNPDDPFAGMGDLGDSPSEFAGGGMMDINRMTAPLGYAAGGPIPEESGGLQPPTGLSKWYSDKFPVDPIHQMKENLIDKGKRTVKGIGRGISGLAGIGQELLGAGPAEASEISPAEELKLLKLQLMLEKGMEGSTLMPSGNPDKIKRLEDRIIEIYTQLGE